MKKYYTLLTGTMFLAVLQTNAQTKIGGTGAPDGSAMLEVTSGTANNKGLLLPRMTTAQRDVIPSPAKGLMIYNTTTNQAEINNGTPVLPVWAATTTSGTAWTTDGNTGTNPGTDFIGTTDNQPLTLRTNNTEKVRVTETGNVGIGTNAPAAKLHVDTGGLRISNGPTPMSNSAITVINDGGGPNNNDNIIINSYGASTRPAFGTYSARGTASAPVNSQAGDLIGSLYFNAQVNNAVGNLNLIESRYQGDGTTSKSRMSFYTSNTQQMTIDSSGFVGIGTNAPATKLHVDTGGLRISNGTVALSSPAIQLINDGGGAGNNDNIVINSYGNITQPAFGTYSARGTASAPANSQAGDLIGSLYFGAWVNGAADNVNLIESRYVGDGTTSKSKMTFRVSAVSRVTIDSSGFVGIGTTSPAAKLHVDTGGLSISNGPVVLSSPALNVINDGGGIGNNDNIVINSYGTSTSPSFGTYSARGTASAPANSQAGDNIGNFYFGAWVNGVVDNLNRIESSYLGDGTTSKARMVFHVSDAPRVSIDSSGHVGIGTGASIPTTRLHVADTGDVAIRIASSTNGKSRVQLGNDNHGIIRNLTASGGAGNDLAVYTSSNGTGADLYLVANPVASNSNNLPLNQFVLKSSGLIGIGTNTPTAMLSVNGTSNNLSGTWGIFSDARVKTIDGAYEDGLASVMKIHPVKFHYNANAPFKSNEQQIGIIAQEMEQIAPYMVTKIAAEGFDDLRQYNNQALPYMLVNAIQEQQKQIEALKAENQKLKNTEAVTAQLMERVKQMEQMMGIKEIEGSSKVAGK